MIISVSPPINTNITWQKVEDSLSKISAGQAGVYGVKSSGSTYCRQGTVGNTGNIGTGILNVNVHVYVTLCISLYPNSTFEFAKTK